MTEEKKPVSNEETQTTTATVAPEETKTDLGAEPTPDTQPKPGEANRSGNLSAEEKEAFTPKPVIPVLEDAPENKATPVTKQTPGVIERDDIPTGGEGTDMSPVPYDPISTRDDTE